MSALIMARRRKEEGGGVPEWMCTFGDMMSLLLCFFIMLFALSIITPIRFQALTDSLKQEFGHPGSSPAPSKGPKATTVASDSAAKNRRTSVALGGQPIAGPKGESPDVHTVLLDGETIKNGVIRFEFGSDKLTEQAQWELRTTALPILRGTAQKIVVRGYVAPTEGSGDYPRESDLAFFRALNVVDYFVDSLGFDRDFFDVDFAPGTLPSPNVLPSGTEPDQAGASVEIILLNQTRRSL